MGIFTNGIHRTNQGLEKKENSLEVRLQEFCERHERSRKQYIITPEGEVNCCGSVYIWDDDLVDGKFPFKFDNVKDNFNCSGCLNLTSLEGSPQKVGVSFRFWGCVKITSLDGCPKEVGDDFSCHHCGKSFTIEEVKQRCKATGNIYV